MSKKVKEKIRAKDKPHSNICIHLPTAHRDVIWLMDLISITKRTSVSSLGLKLMQDFLSEQGFMKDEFNVDLKKIRAAINSIEGQPALPEDRIRAIKEYFKV